LVKQEKLGRQGSDRLTIFARRDANIRLIVSYR
jgi:hypothetical protein